MITTKEKIIPDGFVDKKATLEILDVIVNRLPIVIKEFKVESKIVGTQKLYYKVEDLKKAINEVDEFHQNHYSGKYVYDNLVSSHVVKSNNIEIIPIPEHYRYILRNKYNVKFMNIFYRKKDINDLKQHIDTVKKEGFKIDGFVDRDTVLKMFEVDSPNFFKLKPVVEGFNISTKINYPNIVYKLEDVNKAIDELKDFFEKHYFSSDVVKKVSYNAINSHNIKKIDIPKHYTSLLSKTYNTKNKSTVYKKSQIDELRKELDDRIDEVSESRKIKDIENEKQEQVDNLIKSGKYVDSVETLKRLSFMPTNFKILIAFRKMNYLDYVIVKGKYYYYSVDDIDNIIIKREKFFEEYVPIGSSQCNAYFEEYNTKLRVQSYKLKKYEVPVYCHGCTEKYGPFYSGKGALKISELKDCLDKYKENEDKIIRRKIEGETLFETFLIRLENYAYWEGFNKNSNYTKEKFVNYVQNNLSKKTSKSTADMKIRRYISLGVTLKDILDRYNVGELYLLNDSQINLYMRTIATKQVKIDLYQFLSLVNIDLKKLGLTSKLKFNFGNVEDPRKKENKDMEQLENAEKDLYNFETYAKVFNYLADIDNHIPKIIDELESQNSVAHASLWLYSILHLNNAWRNGDCNRFPELIIKDLIEEYDIKDIKWFENNRLTLPQSKAIIFRVRQWEMRMSKTQINGVFFCSDELSPAFATSVIILHLYKYSNNVISEDEKHKLIMDFGTRNNEVTKSMTKKFFKPAKIKGFKFSSRKFNKSIMTYIYFLANLSGDDKAYIYAQTLRNHIDIKSTAPYVDFDINQVESLGRQLFARGEFGYIPALLAQKVLGNGDVGSFEEMTNQIMNINAVFGDIQNINNTARFLNVIRTETQNVIDMISEKSFEECQEIYTSMCTMSLPSKCGSDIQCLFSKQDCQMPNLDDEDDCACFDCPYHIPSIYALTKLCKNLIDSYKDYLGLPKNIELKDFKNYLLQNPEPKPHLSKKSRMQIGLKIERRKVLLNEAIQKYGEEYIYRCLNIERKIFIELSDIVKLDFYETYPELIN